jgi:hypothetical protein
MFIRAAASTGDTPSGSRNPFKAFLRGASPGDLSAAWLDLIECRSAYGDRSGRYSPMNCITAAASTMSFGRKRTEWALERSNIGR